MLRLIFWVIWQVYDHRWVPGAIEVHDCVSAWDHKVGIVANPENQDANLFAIRSFLISESLVVVKRTFLILKLFAFHRNQCDPQCRGYTPCQSEQLLPCKVCDERTTERPSIRMNSLSKQIKGTKHRLLPCEWPVAMNKTTKHLWFMLHS